MDDGPDGKPGKSEKPEMDSNAEKGGISSEASQDGQSTKQSPVENEKPRVQPSESDSTVNNDDFSNIRKKDTETIPVPKDAKEDDEDAVFAHLPEHEAAILKEQLHIPDVKITFVGLFRYASTNDILVLIVSAICSIAAGAVMPLFTVGYNTLSE